MSRSLLFNKPFRVMSQFSPAADKRTLADYIDVPGVYPAGRLDYDSEGLMLLTDDGRLQSRVADPRYRLCGLGILYPEAHANGQPGQRPDDP